jgi:hypothetical protein
VGVPLSEDWALAKQVTLKLLAYCRENAWSGYDPYDALNSRVYQNLPILHFRAARLVLTQGIKRCPLNLRPLLLVPRTQNPKALALFLSALLKLSKLGLIEENGFIWSLIERLEALRSPHPRYWCWGYSFPWQTRTLLVPRHAPNLVCTSFVGEALLDLYEERGEPACLRMAVSAADYILGELYWTEGESVASLRYPHPSVRSLIHNANFLGAALLCRVVKHSGERRFLEPALRVARYSAGRQRADGAWVYGELPTQQWIDNFHTGFNLCGLRRVAQSAGTAEFDGHLRRGFDFYRAHFFRPDGAPRYFHNRVYPLDVHSAAQSIITLLALDDLDESNARLAVQVLQWSMANLWDDRGYFYHQKLSWGRVKVPYMRWGQGWMLLALACLLERGAEARAGGRLANEMVEAAR